MMMAMTGRDDDAAGGGRTAGDRPGDRPGERHGAGPGPAEAAARHALDAYPTLVTAGVAFTCVEEVDRRWRVLSAANDTPQQARDELAHHFLVIAAESDGAAAGAEFRRAAGVLARERHDELVVAARRFRIGRIERSARMGPDGPEPPRSTDPDSPAGEPSTSRRSIGFIDENALTGTAAAVTRHALHNRIPELGTARMRDDASRALDTHPRLVLLPAEFAVAEEAEGRWQPLNGASEVTPQAARDSLITYFRVIIPGPDSADETFARFAGELGHESPGPAVVEEYAGAADLLERDRLNDLRVAARHFRVIRVEQIVRLGRDGPEPPRPSDPDPYGPPAAHLDANDAPGTV